MTIGLSPLTSAKAFLSLPKETSNPLRNYYISPLPPPLDASHLLPSSMCLHMGNLCASLPTGASGSLRRSLGSEGLSASLLSFLQGWIHLHHSAHLSWLFSHFFFSPVMYESLVLSVRTEPHSHLLFKATIYQGCKTRVLERYKEWATRRQRC